jgi:hypothetical protein
MGKFTGYYDMQGKPINLGDQVKLGEFTFEVDKNPFNGLYVVDGDTGQDFLANVYKQVRVTPNEVDIHEMMRKVNEIRERFIHHFMRVPNRVYIGANLVEAAVAHLRKQYWVDVIGYPSVYKLMDMEVVPVKEDDHISLGLTMD